jgi:hypothetical protein
MMACGAVASFQLQRNVQRERVELIVDMSVSAGDYAELYVNDFFYSPYRVVLEPNQRNSYKFTGLPRTIDVIRFDPTNVAHATIQLHQVSILKGGRKVKEFGPSELLWERSNIATRDSASDLSLESTTDDPVMRAYPKYAAPGFALALPLLEAPLGNARSPNLFFLLLALTLLMAIGSAATRYHSLFVLASYGLIYGLATLLLRRHGLPPAPSVAVGYASWIGYSKSIETTAVWVALAGVMALAFLYRWLARRFSGERTITKDSPGNHLVWAGTLVFLFLAALFTPDLTYVAGTLKNIRYEGQWDLNNITVWRYMTSSGLLAYKDFWYPYGFVRAFTGKFPGPELLQYLNTVIVAFELFVGISLCVGKRIWFPFFVVLVLVSGLFCGLFPHIDRYLLSINVCLFYISLHSSAHTTWKRDALFGLVVIHAILLDPSQAIYAAPAILLKNLLDCLTLRQTTVFQVAKHLVWEFRFPLGFAALFAVYLAYMGQIGAAVRIYGNLGDMATYSSVPVEIHAWLRSMDSSALIVVIACLVGLGLVIRTFAKDPAAPASNVLLVTSVTTFVASQKMLIRPFAMVEQLMPMAVVAILLYLFHCYSQSKWLLRAPLYLSVGASLALFLYLGAFQNMLERLKLSLPTTAHNIHMLVDRQEIEKVNRSQFARDRFNLDKDLYEVSTTLQSEYGVSSNDTIYVLGDNAILYILLGVRPPYHINFYNSSPIYEQQIVANWLEQVKPKYVVWDTEAKIFDGVPNVVRCPITFEKVINDFAAHKTVGRYEILRRREPTEPIDVSFWRSRLGETVDIGHLARLSSARKLENCESVLSDSCSEFLEVTADKNTADHIDIPMHVKGTRFFVRLAIVPGETAYAVALDRIWFWHALRSQGVQLQLESLPEGINAKIIAKHLNPTILY